MRRYLALQKIVELGSFSKAAEALGYTQSSMSQMIASLEEELSIKLLNRFRTGAKLTLEGEELYPYIERMIYQYWACLLYTSMASDAALVWWSIPIAEVIGCAAAVILTWRLYKARVAVL